MCGPFIKFLTKLNEKPAFLHISLILGVIMYSGAGGFVFRALESSTHRELVKKQFEERIRCFTTVISNTTDTQIRQNGEQNTSWTAREVFNLCVLNKEELEDWNLLGSTLFGFGIVTTLGIGRLAPVTVSGRVFCIFFGMCGIPLTMLVLANMGKGLNESSTSARQKIADYRKKKREEKGEETGVEPGREEVLEPTGLLVLAGFLCYIVLGSLLLNAVHERMDFVTGLYFTFLSLTALEFRALVPRDPKYLPIILAYICCGIAITTIAIDVGSDYLKRLHFLGKKVENTRNVAIWFGGKKIYVQDLVDSVCDRCGVEPSTLRNLDIDAVVTKAIDVKEGTCPPWAHRRQAIADGNNLPPIDTDLSSDDSSDVESGRLNRKASLASPSTPPPPAPTSFNYLQMYVAGSSAPPLACDDEADEESAKRTDTNSVPQLPVLPSFRIDQPFSPLPPPPVTPGWRRRWRFWRQ